MPTGGGPLLCPSLYHLHRDAPLDGDVVRAEERVRRVNRFMRLAAV